MEVLEPVGVRVVHTNIREKSTLYVKGNEHDTRTLSIVNFITAGRMAYSINGRTLTARRNELVCLDTRMRIERLPCPGHPGSFIAVSFQIVVEDRGLATPADFGIPPVLRPSNPNAFRKIMGELNEAFRSTRAFRLSDAARKGLELLTLLRREKSTLPPHAHSPAGRMNRRIREALGLISERYKEAINFKLLAREIGMHPSYFTHLFKKEIGMPPSQYLLEVKIAKAKDFFTGYGLSISTVALELGFHDHAHFYRTFKARTGMSPREYLRTNRPFYDPR